MPPNEGQLADNGDPGDWLKAWLTFVAYSMACLGFLALLVLMRWFLIR